MTVKYLYKYLYKGYDRATVTFSQPNNISNTQSNKTELIDKIKIYLDVKYVSASKNI